jgi:hypothetical protein
LVSIASSQYASSRDSYSQLYDGAAKYLSLVLNLYNTGIADLNSASGQTLTKGLMV